MRPSRILLICLAIFGLAGCLPKIEDPDRDTTLVVGIAAKPLSLDPAVFATGNDYPVQELIYHQLLAVDPTTPEGVAPELATAWQFSADGMSIDLSLRDDLSFDSGAPVNAEAVAFSLERVKEVGRWSSAYVEWLDRVEVVDPTTVRLHMKRPYRPALQALTSAATSIVDPTIAELDQSDSLGLKALRSASAGSGPYRIGAIAEDGSVTLELRSASEAPAFFQKVRFLVVPDEGVRRLLLERGDIDLTYAVPAAFVERYRALPGVDLALGEGGISLSYLTLNNREPPFSDRKVRQAVHYAINHSGLRENVLAGNAVHVPGYRPRKLDDPDAVPERDLVRANRLLEEAGYDGEPIQFLTAQVGPVGEFVQTNLREAGLNIEIVKRDPASLEQLKSQGEFGLVYEGWLMDTADPSTLYESLFLSSNIAAGVNGSGYSNPELDKLVGRLVVEPDPDSRQTLIDEIDAILQRDRPVVMIFSALPVFAYQTTLEGFEPNPIKPFLLNVEGMSRRTESTR